MVKEFTDLQGIVGGLYARAQGERGDLRAIYEHYKPLSMEDEIPSSPGGRILSLADKWDTLTECLKVGMTPTGSATRLDFAARPRVSSASWWRAGTKQRRHGQWRFREFLRDRVEYYFRDHRGFAYDEVRACMAAGWTDLLDLESRLKRVQSVRDADNFEPIAASFKRIKNIVKQAGISHFTFEAKLLEPGPETELYGTMPRTQGQPLESSRNRTAAA